MPTTLFESMTEQRFLKTYLATPSMNEATPGNSALIASLDAQPVQSKYAWEVPQLPEFIFENERRLRFSIFTTTDAAYVITPPNICRDNRQTVGHRFENDVWTDFIIGSQN